MAGPLDDYSARNRDGADLIWIINVVDVEDCKLIWSQRVQRLDPRLTVIIDKSTDVDAFIVVHVFSLSDAALA